jgi:hypothetical protein
MSLFHWIMGRGWKGRQIDELAEQLAVGCAGDVWRCLSEQVSRMSVHELRGYVRTHAAGVVRRVTDDAGRRGSIPASRLSRLYDAVLEVTTQLVMHQVLSRARRKSVRQAA